MRNKENTYFPFPLPGPGTVRHGSKHGQHLKGLQVGRMRGEDPSLRARRRRYSKKSVERGFREEFGGKGDVAIQALSSKGHIGKDSGLGRNGRVAQIKGYPEMYG